MPARTNLLILVSFTMAACAADDGRLGTDEEAAAVTADDQAEPAHGRFRYHCVASWGIDANEVLNVRDAALISPFCPELAIHPSDTAIAPAGWITNEAGGVPGVPIAYPPTYVPAKAAPRADFLHKLERVRLVVQPGDRELVFHPRQIDRSLAVGDLLNGSGIVPPEFYPLPLTDFLGKLPRLEVGTYTVEIHFIMSDIHCDGLGTDIAVNCLQAGDNLIRMQEFAIVPPTGPDPQNGP